MYQYTIQKNVDVVKDVGVISARKNGNNVSEISSHISPVSVLFDISGFGTSRSPVISPL